MKLVYVNEAGESKTVDVPSIEWGKNVAVPVTGVRAVVGFCTGADVSSQLRESAEQAWYEEGSKVLVVDPRDVITLCDSLDIARGKANEEIARAFAQEDVERFRELALHAASNDFPAPVTGYEVKHLCTMIEVLAAQLAATRT